MSEPTYPGATATADQVLRLAVSYRMSAKALASAKGDAISRAPCRFLALHAIELYLNALLLHSGLEATAIRGMQHNVSRKLDLAGTELVLRARTRMHLTAITSEREYLAMRYESQMPASLPHLNRMLATLDELALKITAIVQVPQPRRKSEADANAKSAGTPVNAAAP